MKVTLIAPPWIFKEEIEFVSQNLSLGYIASFLEKHGHEVVIIDALLKGINTSSTLHTKYADVMRWGLSDDEILDFIPLDSDLIGITAPFTDSRFIVNPLSKRIKEVFPNIPLVMGGVYPSTIPNEAMRSSAADILVLGEGELAMSHLASGKRLHDIKGIVFRENGVVLNTGRGETVQDIESDIPMPSYTLRAMDEYVRWSPRGNKKDRTLSVVSSRGCPFDCEFCSIYNIYGRNWRQFSAERVLSEIQIAVDMFGISHVEFEDDNLTLQKKRTLAIFHGLQKITGGNGERVKWSAPNGVMIDTLDRDIIIAMKESGAELLYLPVESGDINMLKLMKKPKWRTHLDKTLEVARLCAEVGIETSAFFIVAYPGEDKKAFQNTLDYCERLLDAGCNAITPLVATPYPNTSLHKVCEDNGWLVHKDMENVLIYQRYSDFLPEFCLVDTPMCSRQEAYERHRIMMERFQIHHNIHKE